MLLNYFVFGFCFTIATLRWYEDKKLGFGVVINYFLAILNLFCAIRLG